MLIETEHTLSSHVLNHANALMISVVYSGLSPSMQCFVATCALRVHVYKKINAVDSILHQFLFISNQSSGFVTILPQIAAENTNLEVFGTVLVKQKCNKGHYTFVLIAQSLFHFCAKNKFNLIKYCKVELLVKTSRNLQKLFCKTTPKH